MTRRAPAPEPWPVWPETDRRTFESVGAALLAGRFAVSGPKTPWEPRLALAARAVADLLGRRHAVLTPSGSSALVIALQALGVGPGDGVLVPAVTWIACATAVMRVGARPIYVDSSPGSPTVDAAALGAALARARDGGWPVRCWLAVHLYAERVDVAGLRPLLPAGVRVLEDGSHSHGARHLDGRPVGSDGDLAVFSLQATKPLTAGEGGCVVTDDPEMAARLFALGTDGRRWAGPEAKLGACPLVPTGDQHGAHHSMPELSAALLMDQAERFDEQCRRRARGLAALRDGLVGGVPRLLAHPAAFDDGAFYGVAVDLGPSGTADGDGDLFATLHGQTGVLAGSLYPPIPTAGHYHPDTIPGFGALGDDRPDLPAAERWRRRALLIDHRYFLAAPERLHDLGRRFRQGFAGPDRRSRSAARPTGGESEPEVSVVVLTRADRSGVSRAIESIEGQSAAVSTEILVVIDGDGPLAGELAADRRLRTVGIRAGETLGTDTAGRVAALRNLALPLTRAPLVCFLDDDNRWRHDHLATLLAERERSGCPAVHSWRAVEDREGEPVVLDTFPWSDDPVLERRQRDACRALGLLDGETPTIRDTVSAPYEGHDYGMVDMGAWLFDRRLLELVAFETRFGEEDRRWGYTEDDKLVAALRRLAVPTSCTRLPTLVYTVGGYSNPSSPSS